MADDDLRSVRVEVDVVHEQMPGDSPELDPTAPGGVPPSLLLLGLAGLVLVVGALVFVRPASNEAADGSERSVPTTMPERVDQEDAAVDDPEIGSGGLDEAGPLVPLVADAPFSVSSIIRTRDGFLGIVPTQIGENPVYRSADGVSWDRIESTLRSASDLDIDNIRWTGLTNAGGGLALTGSIGRQPKTEFFVSSDGNVWNRLFLDFFVEEGVRPLVGFDNTVIGVGIGEVRPAPTTGSVAYEDIISCLADFDAAEEFPVGFVTPSSLWAVDSGGAEVVLGAQGGPRRLGDGPATWNLVDEPVPLSSRQVALVDGGFRSYESCAGALEVAGDRDPAIVVLDLDTGAEQRFILPDRLATLGKFEVLGEVAPGDARPRLLIEIDGGLELLDTDTGRWSRLVRGVSCVLPFCNPIEEEQGSYLVSTTGERVYQLNEEGLRVREFASTSDRIFIENEFLVERDSESVSPLTDIVLGNLEFAELVYADDDVVFFRELNGRLWGVGLGSPR